MFLFIIGTNLTVLYEAIDEFKQLCSTLSDEQVNKLKSLGDTLNDKDTKRSGWQFIKTELGIAGSILQNCNKNENSYLTGLMQVFPKERATALLKTIIEQ